MTGAIITSHSIDGTFESCPRRFEFLHSFMRAADRVENKYAADVGTAVHEAVQEWQRKLFHGASNNEAIEAGEYTLIRFWPWKREMEMLASGTLKTKRNMGNAILLFDEIVKFDEFWNFWELVEIDNFGPAIEVPWRITHRSLGTVKNGWGEDCYFVTQGKIDFLLRHKQTGEVRVIDLKTTEKKTHVHDAMFRYSGQAGQYGLVLNHVLGLDWKRDGLNVCYLMLGFDEYESIVYPKVYHLPPDEVQDAIDLKVERLMRMRSYANAEHWPRRGHGCEFFSVPCGFLDICQRRDNDFIREWFEFELASGRFSEYNRIYDPTWTMEA